MIAIIETLQSNSTLKELLTTDHVDPVGGRYIVEISRENLREAQENNEEVNSRLASVSSRGKRMGT